MRRRAFMKVARCACFFMVICACVFMFPDICLGGSEDNSVSITETVDPKTVRPGDYVTYTVTIALGEDELLNGTFVEENYSSYLEEVQVDQVTGASFRVESAGSPMKIYIWEPDDPDNLDDPSDPHNLHGVCNVTITLKAKVKDNAPEGEIENTATIFSKDIRSGNNVNNGTAAVAFGVVFPQPKPEKQTNPKGELDRNNDTGDNKGIEGIALLALLSIAAVAGVIKISTGNDSR